MKWFGALSSILVCLVLQAGPRSQSFIERLSNSDYTQSVDFILDNEAQLEELIAMELERSSSDSLLSELNFLCSEVSNISPEAQKILGEAILFHSLRLRDTVNIMEASSNIAGALMNEGNYEEALTYFYRRLEYEQNSQNEIDGIIFNSIGNTYYMMNDHQNSVEYLKKYLELGIARNDSATICRAYLNISNPYYDKGEFDSSMYYLQKSLQIATSIGDFIIQSYALGNLASMYLEMGDYQTTLDYQLRGLAIEEGFNDKIAMSDSHTVLAGCYASLGDAEKAEFHLQQALKLASGLSAKTKLMAIYSEGATVYEKLQDYQKAYRMSLQHHTLYDSLLRGERTRQIADMREKYETAQKEKEITSLEEGRRIADLELEQERNQNLMLIGASILLVIILILVSVFFLQVRKQKREVESRNAIISEINQDLEKSRNELIISNQTKDKFFALVAHDLRGPVTSLQGMGQMLDYYTKKGDSDRLFMLTSQLDQATSSVSHLLDNLLKWALTQTQGLSFQPERFQLNALINDTVQVFDQAVRAKEVVIELIMEQEVKVRADYNMMSTVFRNLLSNAIKFSPLKKKVTVMVAMQAGLATISVSDQGEGIPQSVIDQITSDGLVSSSAGTLGEKGTGLGLSLCKQFMDLHDQRLVIANTGHGTIITFYISVA